MSGNGQIEEVKKFLLSRLAEKRDVTMMTRQFRLLKGEIPRHLDNSLYDAAVAELEAEGRIQRGHPVDSLTSMTRLIG